MLKQGGDTEKQIMNLKLNHEKTMADYKLSRENESTLLINQLKQEIVKREKEVERLEGLIATKDKQINRVHEEVEKVRSKEIAKKQKGDEEYERKLERKDAEIQFVKQQLQAKID